MPTTPGDRRGGRWGRGMGSFIIARPLRSEAGRQGGQDPVLPSDGGFSMEILIVTCLLDHFDLNFILMGRQWKKVSMRSKCIIFTFRVKWFSAWIKCRQTFYCNKLNFGKEMGHY